MPATRILIGKKLLTTAMSYGYVLWADVPAGNQIAYRNPAAISAHANVTSAQLQLIRDGQVAERPGVYKAILGTPLATMQSALEALWTTFQNEITAEVPWGEFGRYWSNVPAWNASPGVPWFWPDQEIVNASFLALTPQSVFAANKFHFVLFNNAVVATSQAFVIKVRKLVVFPGVTAVTGVAPSLWSVRRRETPTTAPAGGIVTVSPMDSAAPLPSTVTVHNAPSTVPAGGTLVTINEFIPQADELKLTTLDAPTRSSQNPWGGLTLYDAHDVPSARSLTIRPNQLLEVQQSATAGTGNCKVLCVFTIG